MSFNRWMVKQTVVYLHEYVYYGTLRCSKKEWTIDTCNNLDESPGKDIEWKKHQSQKVRYYVTPFILHSWNDKFTETETRLVLVRGEGEVGVFVKGILVMKLSCILTVVVVTWIYTWWKCMELKKHVFQERQFSLSKLWPQVLCRLGCLWSWVRSVSK